MKKAVAVAAICLGVCLALLAAGNFTPLNVKTGLWQMTETIHWTGLPPQYAAMLKNGQARKYKSCVKPKDLSTNPWANGSGEHCVWTVLNSSATDMEVLGKSCDFGKEYGMSADVHGKIHVTSPVSGAGSFDIHMTGNGQNMKGHADYTGQWVSANCN